MTWMMLALSLIGCGSSPAPSLKTETAAVDGRSQYDLVAEIVEAHDAMQDLDDEDGPVADPYGAVRSRWVGHRYRWEGRYIPSVCQGEAACPLLPFDHARATTPIVQGWMPKLELDAEQRERIAELCAPHDGCVVRFEGELRDLNLSAEEPTSVTFGDVVVEGARSTRPEECWIRCS